MDNRVKWGLHWNTNRTQMRHSKTMRMFNVDVLPRQANSIRLCDECSANSQMLSIDCWYIKGNLHTICLCLVDSLPRRMPNSLQRCLTFCLSSCPHASFAFACRCKPSLMEMLSNLNATKPSFVEHEESDYLACTDSDHIHMDQVYW